MCMLLLSIPITYANAAHPPKNSVVESGVHYITDDDDDSTVNVKTVNAPSTNTVQTVQYVDNGEPIKTVSSEQVVKKQKDKPSTSDKSLSLQSIKKNFHKLVAPEPNDNYRKVQLNELSNFEYGNTYAKDLPVITQQNKTASKTTAVQGAKATSTNALPGVYQPKTLNFYDAIQLAVQRHPEISQSIASLASQNASIDVAKAAYYPQISGGVSTGGLTQSNTSTTAGRGQQMFSINATQMLFDFGKVKSSVDVQQAKLLVAQADVLVSIDDIAYQVADAIVNIKRYQEVCRIAQEQINGIGRISEIANLRANAGISSQADPVQAQSYLEAARSNLIAQQTQLRIYQERLRTLLGIDVVSMNWDIPDSIVKSSEVYGDTAFNTIPKMMAAKAQVDVAAFQKKQVQLSRYPTLNLTGSVSQAVNGINPNNSKDDGFYSSVMLQATSNFYQGGATAAQTKAASYAEEAAKSQVNSVYLDVLNQIRATKENIENKQRQMQVLVAQQATTVRTKELYQEQYKLGTRTVVDLLNAEQSIHSANSQIESTRYDIYDSLVQFIAATGKSRDVYKLNNLSIQGVEIQP